MIEDLSGTKENHAEQIEGLGGRPAKDAGRRLFYCIGKYVWLSGPRSKAGESREGAVFVLYRWQEDGK